MKINLKLYATLARCLPAGAKRNQIEIDLAEGSTVEDVLAAHNVPRDNCHLILINGVFSPPASAGEATLKDGDALAIWPPVAGG